MNKEKINTITPFLFEDHFLISFDKKWIEVFAGIPKFIVFIDQDNKLHIISEKVVD